MGKTYSIPAILGFIIRLALSIEWFRGIGRVPVLRDLRSTSALGEYPALSVIVPARNEERAVRAGVESMLAQDYPGEFEVIAVDDRSTDRTGDVLRELRDERPRLRVLYVPELPEGWLGKNHALALGAAEARGEWLLFTDADVRITPDCLREAVGYAVRNHLDHLTLAPEIVSEGVMLKSFVVAFEMIFEMTQRPWRARDPRAKEAVGVGAFNLLRRDVYLRIGGYRAIALRPDDDMKLAKLVKKGGFKQDVALGTDLISVEWHRTVGGAVRGLSKSIFPGVDYRLDAVVFGAILLLLIDVLPFAGIALARGNSRVFFGLSVILTFAIYAYRARHSKLPLLYAALHPVSVSIFIYAMLRSAYTTLANGGIEWRDTKYPLEALKKNVV